jgi:proline iminopeptidase
LKLNGLLAAMVAVMLGASAAQAQGPVFTTGSFQNAGLTLHYTMAGQGSPVVLLSGGPGMDASYLEPVAEIVAAHHTAILLDQRGTTGSMPVPLDATTLSPELLVSDMEALRTALKLEKWTVLGHSAGAQLAMEYATAHADRLTALVLVGTVPPTSNDLQAMMDNVSVRLSAETSKKMAAVSESKESPDAQMAAGLRLFFPADFFDQAAAAKFVQTMTPGTCHAATARILETAMPTYDLRPGLAKLHVPTLVLQGRQDPLDLAMAAETRDAIPGAKLVIVERAGHFSWLDNPGGFTEALNSFLGSTR